VVHAPHLVAPPCGRPKAPSDLDDIHPHILRSGSALAAAPWSRRALAAERARTFIRAAGGQVHFRHLSPLSYVSCHDNQEGDIGFDVRSGQVGEPCVSPALRLRWEEAEAREARASGDADQVREVQVLPRDDDEVDRRAAEIELVLDALRVHVPDHIVAVQPPGQRRANSEADEANPVGPSSCTNSSWFSRGRTRSSGAASRCPRSARSGTCTSPSKTQWVGWITTRVPAARRGRAEGCVHRHSDR
jgi:hypothetical protein